MFKLIDDLKIDKSILCPFCKSKVCTNQYSYFCNCKNDFYISGNLKKIDYYFYLNNKKYIADIYLDIDEIHLCSIDGLFSYKGKVPNIDFSDLQKQMELMIVFI